MKNFKSVLFVSIFVFLFSFSFAQVEDTVDEITEDAVESIELESEDNLNLDEEVENVENNDLSNLEGVSIVSQQLDEESDIELYGEEEDLSLVEHNKGSLRSLAMGFCNNGLENITASLDAVVQEGVPYKVCIVATNTSDDDIVVNLDLSSAGPDQLGNLVCYGDTDFSKYVVNADELSQFTIPANNYVVKEAEILYPLGIKENQAGCFAIWIDGGDTSTDGGGAVQMSAISRKGMVAKFYVGSLSDIKNELKISNIDTMLNESGDVILTFDVENIGNLENELEVKGVIKNIFGFTNTFSSVIDGSANDNIIPGHISTIVVDLGRIPNYGGLFSIEFEVTGTPYFSYELSDDFDKSLLEPLTYTEKTTYFEMPWLICIIVVIIIILLIVLFRKPKPQVVYVQAPQQPQQPQYQQPQYQNPQYQQPVNNQVPQQPQYQQPQQPMQQ